MLRLRSGGEKREEANPVKVSQTTKMATPGAGKEVRAKHATLADESHCKEQLSIALPFERTPVHGPLPLVDTPPTAAEPPFNECLQHNGRSLVSYRRDMIPTRDSATSKD